MTEKLDLYICNICGNLVEVVKSGGGTLVCCGEDMELLDIKNHTGEESTHKPVIEIGEDEKTIRVGQAPHDMTKEHYIEFIEVISDDGNFIKRKYLSPEEEPVFRFKCNCKSGMKARELCNIHGLWVS